MKPHICGILDLRFKRQAKSIRAVSKEGLFAIFWLFLTFLFKNIVNESASGSDFSCISS